MLAFKLQGKCRKGFGLGTESIISYASSSVPIQGPSRVSGNQQTSPSTRRHPSRKGQKKPVFSPLALCTPPRPSSTIPISRRPPADDRQQVAMAQSLPARLAWVDQTLERRRSSIAPSLTVVWRPAESLVCSHLDLAAMVDYAKLVVLPRCTRRLSFRFCTPRQRFPPIACHASDSRQINRPVAAGRSGFLPAGKLPRSGSFAASHLRCWKSGYRGHATDDLRASAHRAHRASPVLHRSIAASGTR